MREVPDSNRGHSQRGCATLEANKRLKKSQIKVMLLPRFEPGALRMTGQNYNHYTIVLYILKGSEVIFMFFAKAFH